MNIEIKKLTPELLEDYLHFFDTTPPHTTKTEDKCYWLCTQTCVTWGNANYEGKDFSTAEKRRDTATAYINGNNIKEYLAYCDNKVVEWCNANTKSDCFECQSEKMYMGSF